MKSYLLVAMVVSAFGISAQSLRQTIVPPVANAQTQAIRKNPRLIAHIEHDGLSFSIAIDAADESFLKIVVPRRTQSYIESSLPAVRLKVVMVDESIIDGAAVRNIGVISNAGWDDITYRFALRKRAAVDDIFSITIWIGDETYTVFLV
jgi:hypothetical protein